METEKQIPNNQKGQSIPPSSKTSSDSTTLFMAGNTAFKPKSTPSTPTSRVQVASGECLKVSSVNAPKVNVDKGGLKSPANNSIKENINDQEQPEVNYMQLYKLLLFKAQNNIPSDLIFNQSELYAPLNQYNVVKPLGVQKSILNIQQNYLKPLNMSQGPNILPFLQRSRSEYSYLNPQQQTTYEQQQQSILQQNNSIQNNKNNKSEENNQNNNQLENQSMANSVGNQISRSQDLQLNSLSQQSNFLNHSEFTKMLLAHQMSKGQENGSNINLNSDNQQSNHQLIMKHEKSISNNQDLQIPSIVPYHESKQILNTSSTTVTTTQNQQHKVLMKKVKKTKICNCKKTQCLKLYCDCFAVGELCGDQCKCCSCCNNEDNLQIRAETIEQILEKNPYAFNSKDELNDKKEKNQKRGCNCRRSGCLKKYCQCYNEGLKCTEYCKCTECANMECSNGGGSIHNNNKRIFAESESGCESYPVTNKHLNNKNPHLQTHNHHHNNGNKQTEETDSDSVPNNSYDDDDLSNTSKKRKVLLVERPQKQQGFVLNKQRSQNRKNILALSHSNSQQESEQGDRNKNNNNNLQQNERSNSSPSCSYSSLPQDFQHNQNKINNQNSLPLTPLMMNPLSNLASVGQLTQAQLMMMVQTFKQGYQFNSDPSQFNLFAQPNMQQIFNNNNNLNCLSQKPTEQPKTDIQKK